MSVPENRVVHAARSYNYVEPGKKHYGAPSDYFAQMALVHRTMCGVPLGAIEGLLEHVVKTAATKPLVGTIFARQSASPDVPKAMGEAAMKITQAGPAIEPHTYLSAWDT